MKFINLSDHIYWINKLYFSSSLSLRKWELFLVRDRKSFSSFNSLFSRKTYKSPIGESPLDWELFL